MHSITDLHNLASFCSKEIERQGMELELLWERVTVLYKLAGGVNHVTSSKCYKHESTWKVLSHTTDRSASNWNPHLHVWSKPWQRSPWTGNNTDMLHIEERDSLASCQSTSLPQTQDKHESWNVYPTLKLTFSSCFHCYVIYVTVTDPHSYQIKTTRWERYC
jgi:hypothetical protein